jgi:hypothetical protein
LRTVLLLSLGGLEGYLGLFMPIHGLSWFDNTLHWAFDRQTSSVVLPQGVFVPLVDDFFTSALVSNAFKFGF